MRTPTMRACQGAMATALVITTACAGHASVPPVQFDETTSVNAVEVQSPGNVVTVEQLRSAITDLKNSDLPRERKTEDDVSVVFGAIISGAAWAISS